MSEPFIAEIKIFAFNFAPRNWAFCDGQLLPINQNQSLFSLLGTTYGGDGRTSFGLPDLRGRTPIHFGEGLNLGNKTGEENHPLTINEIPNHDHVVHGSSLDADTPVPNGALLARANNLYQDPNSLTSIHPETFANAGSGQGHNNMQPYLTLSFGIALAGLFPSRN